MAPPPHPPCPPAWPHEEVHPYSYDAALDHFNRLRRHALLLAHRDEVVSEHDREIYLEVLHGVARNAFIANDVRYDHQYLTANQVMVADGFPDYCTPSDSTPIWLLIALYFVGASAMGWVLFAVCRMNVCRIAACRPKQAYQRHVDDDDRAVGPTRAEPREDDPAKHSQHGGGGVNVDDPKNSAQKHVANAPSKCGEMAGAQSAGGTKVDVEGGCGSSPSASGERSTTQNGNKPISGQSARSMRSRCASAKQSAMDAIMKMGSPTPGLLYWPNSDRRRANLEDGAPKLMQTRKASNVRRPSRDQLATSGLVKAGFSTRRRRMDGYSFVASIGLAPASNSVDNCEPALNDDTEVQVRPPANDGTESVQLESPAADAAAISTDHADHVEKGEAPSTEAADAVDQTEGEDGRDKTGTSHTNDLSA